MVLGLSRYRFTDFFEKCELRFQGKNWDLVVFVSAFLVLTVIGLVEEHVL